MTNILNVAAAMVAIVLATGILAPSSPGWKSVQGTCVNALAVLSLLYLSLFALLDVAGPQ